VPQSVRPLRAGAVMVLLLGLLWTLELLDQASGNALDAYGIRAREVDGLPEILSAPFLHAGWQHLAGNSVPFLVLGFLVLLSGMARWLVSTLTSIVSSGLFAWALTPAGTIVLGASGLIFGWLTYLIARGLWSRRPGQVALGLVVLFLYGGLIWGVLPGAAGISWQAHLGGAVGGLLAARHLHRRAARPVAALPPRYSSTW
jgi:membrane associated rhomboid family serine protease